MATVNGTVVGFIGLIPGLFHAFGKTVTGVYPTAWLVHPDYRATGLGPQMIRRIMARFPMVVGTAARPKAQAVLKALGYRYLHDIPRWVGVLEPTGASQLCLGEEREIRQTMAGRKIRLRHNQGNLKCLEGFSAFETPMDDLWSRLVSRMAVSASRGSAYMNWRYVRHPVFQYRYTVLGSPSRWEGVAVHRVEQVEGRSVRVMRLMEFLAEEHAQSALATAIVEDGLATGCALADFHGLGEHAVSGLIDVGFFQHHEEPAIQIPYRFNPLNHRPNQNFYAWSALRNEYGLSPTSYLNLWYLSRGESDQERPT